MTDLAHYIKRELAGLLRRIDETPPKRYHSLAKLRKLISTAPIDPIHKQDISSSLTAVQSALVASTTRKGRPCKQYSVVKLGDSYIKHLQFQNMLLEEEALNMRADMKMDSHQRRTDRAKIDFTKLNCTNSELQKCMNNELQKCVNNEFQKCVNSELQNDIRQLQQLRSYRLSRQRYLQELIIKGQRLERLKELKVENEQAYLSSKLLEQQYAQKKEVVKGIKREAKEAAKTGRSKKVRSLIGEYREKLG